MCSDWARGPHLCGNLSLWAELCVVNKALIVGTPRTRTVLTEISLTTVGPSSLTSYSLPPSILSPCDNRDIPELVPCLTAGLSLNSSGLRGMLEWRAKQRGSRRRTDKRKWTTLINLSQLLLLVLEAPGRLRQARPAQTHAHTNTHTHRGRENICHTKCKSRASQSICSCVVGLTM